MKKNLMMIEKFEWGKITINGVEYTNDIIMSQHKIINSNWRRNEGHLLELDTDLQSLLITYPHRIVVGTGVNGMMKIDSRLTKLLAGFKSDILNTPDAIKIFNKYAKDKSKLIIGMFHLTC